MQAPPPIADTSSLAPPAVRGIIRRQSAQAPAAMAIQIAQTASGSGDLRSERDERRQRRRELATRLEIFEKFGRSVAPVGDQQSVSCEHERCGDHDADEDQGLDDGPLRRTRGGVFPQPRDRDAQEWQRRDQLATRRRAPTPPERERAGHGGQRQEWQRGERDQPAPLAVTPPEPPPADRGQRKRRCRREHAVFLIGEQSREAGLQAVERHLVRCAIGSRRRRRAPQPPEPGQPTRRRTGRRARPAGEDPSSLGSIVEAGLQPRCQSLGSCGFATSAP